MNGARWLRYKSDEVGLLRVLLSRKLCYSDTDGRTDRSVNYYVIVGGGSLHRALSQNHCCGLTVVIASSLLRVSPTCSAPGKGDGGGGTTQSPLLLSDPPPTPTHSRLALHFSDRFV